MFHRIVLASLALLALGGVALADGEGGPVWLTDFEKAKEIAKAEGKLILVDFTGSDWCGWCIKLHDEVFSRPEFQAYAARCLVLVEIDFPKRKQLSEEQKAANKELRDEFEVRGYPTVLLLDADGDTVLRTGYKPGGPQAYVDHLEAARGGKK